MKRYSMIKWGDTIRGPSKKIESVEEECKLSFDMISADMLYKDLGTRIDKFRRVAKSTL